MLNNKYLAIVLVIAAAALVVYQVFFNKDEPKPIRKQAAHLQQPGQTAAAPPTGSSSAGRAEQKRQPQQPRQQTSQSADDIVIDFHSPMLLKRVYEDPMEPYPRRELPREFGTGIFAAPPEKEPAPEEPVYEREVQFLLNSIVIDDDGKRRVAVINNTILYPGDTINGANVVSIKKSRVVLKFRGKNIVLSTDSRIKTIKWSGGKGDI